MKLRFEEPPPSVVEGAPRPGSYAEFAAALREHQDRWVRVERRFSSLDSAKNTATNMRRGNVKGFTKGEFEVLSGLDDDGNPGLWVRYVGSSEPAKPSGGGPKPPTPDEIADPPRPLAAKVREWAVANGMEVGERGRIPTEVVNAYRQATGDNESDPPDPQPPRTELGLVRS